MVSIMAGSARPRRGTTLRHNSPGRETGAPAPYPGHGTLVESSLNYPGRRRPRWLKVSGIVAAALLVAVIAFGGYWLWRLQSNISTSALGSDTRSGKNGQYGSAADSSGYGQSDVMMLLDISADNNHVNVVSFPRDLLVDVPTCTDHTTNQDHAARPGAMINSAMAEAGIGCAVDTVNKLTGLEVDHFMMADFNAVKELSNAVGGVEV